MSEFVNTGLLLSISKASPPALVKASIRMTLEFRYQDYLHIYTDGSKGEVDGETRMGAAILIPSRDGNFLQGIQSSQRNYSQFIKHTNG